MPILPHTLLSQSPTPVETTVGTEIVLMSLENGECYGLGHPGSDVWRLLTSPITFDHLATQLRTEYEAPPGTLEADLLALLEDLHRRNLILLDPPATP